MTYDLDAHKSYVPEAPEFCSKCGRQLELRAEPDSYFNPKTGQRDTTTYRECPRFPRSWRNLWWGGVGHTSRWGTIGGRQWR